MPIQSPPIQAESYRYLRVAMIGLLLAVAASVVYQSSRQGFILSSVSVYYYTPAQDIVVGALVGLGVSMIALQGMSGAENTFLNLGGMFAIVVAIVPPGHGADFRAAVQACRETAAALQAQRASGIPGCPTAVALADTTRATVENDMASALIVGGLLLVLSGFILVKDRRGRPRGTDRRWALTEFLAAAVVWLWGLVSLAVSVDWLVGNAHYIAAIGFLLAMFLVAGANAHRRGESPAAKGALNSPRAYRYTWIATAMLAGGGVLIALWLAGVISLFWVEVPVAVLFIVFWAVQTVELETAATVANRRETSRAGTGRGWWR